MEPVKVNTDIEPYAWDAPSQPTGPAWSGETQVEFPLTLGDIVQWAQDHLTAIYPKYKVAVRLEPNQLFPIVVTWNFFDGPSSYFYGIDSLLAYYRNTTSRC